MSVAEAQVVVSRCHLGICKPVKNAVATWVSSIRLIDVTH